MARTSGLHSLFGALFLAGAPVVISQEILAPPAAVDAARRETAESSTRTARELVAELERAVERQRELLRGAEAGLARARAMQAGLEGRPEDSPRQPPQGAPAVIPSRRGQEIPSWWGRSRLPGQTAAEEKSWRWSDEKAEAKSSIGALGDRYKARVETSQDAPHRWKFTLTRGGEDVYSWDGHEHSAFVVAGDVLYLADFDAYRSGCAVLARDLRAVRTSGGRRCIPSPSGRRRNTRTGSTSRSTIAT